MLNGLDLFSGIGGLSLALRPWAKPVAYCERERYAQAVLLQRIETGALFNAPIWDDVRTLRGAMLERVDILYGGFPCQDISAAGLGKGLGGERSGLVREIYRLTGECRPAFVFLENVPAIRTRGLIDLVRTFTDLGYDCRWTCVSAEEVGAPHLRKRWFLLAHAHGAELRDKQQWPAAGRLDLQTEGENESKHHGAKRGMATTPNSETVLRPEELGHEPYGHNGRPEAMANPEGERYSGRGGRGGRAKDGTGGGLHASGSSEIVADSDCPRQQHDCESDTGSERESGWHTVADSSWWDAEPAVGRVADGIQNRVHRLRGLGNSVVPLQAQEAFERLVGL